MKMVGKTDAKAKVVRKVSKGAKPSPVKKAIDSPAKSKTQSGDSNASIEHCKS